MKLEFQSKPSHFTWGRLILLAQELQSFQLPRLHHLSPTLITPNLPLFGQGMAELPPKVRKSPVHGTGIAHARQAALPYLVQHTANCVGDFTSQANGYIFWYMQLLPRSTSSPTSHDLPQVCPHSQQNCDGEGSVYYSVE